MEKVPLRDKGCQWDAIRIPESCKGVDVVIGIDEAGRGPVLGSLVYTAAFWPVSEDEAIRKMGFDDSKQLKESERDALIQSIINHPSIGWVIEEIDAVTISEEMLQATPTSLNVLSYDAVIRCLRTIANYGASPPQPTTIYVDTVGDPSTYKGRLTAALGENFAKFVIEKKADAKYKTVSAASIIAKVTRDTILRQWKWQEPSLDLDKNFGSGYPGDEACVNWLKRVRHPVFGYPSLVRFSWSTVKDMMDKRDLMAKASWECDDSEEATSSQRLTSFFSTASTDSSARNNTLTAKRARSAYFTKRKLRRLSGWPDLN